MTSVAFTIPGPAVGKGRPRVGKVGTHARLFTPQKTVSYEGLVAHSAMTAMAGRPIFDEAVTCRLGITCAVPASWSQKKQRAALAGDLHPTSKPDIDNVVKAVFDGLNGVLWRDDVLVVECCVQKLYGPTPGVLVIVWPMKELADSSLVDRQLELAAA